MGIVYSDDDAFNRRGGRPVPYHDQNATGGFLKHYANKLYLDFISKNSKDFRERAQAEKEIQHAHRKMDYWRKHPNYDFEESKRGAEKLHKDWKLPSTDFAFKK